MPTIYDLYRVRQGLAGSSVTIRRLSRLQMMLVSVIAPPGPIINADDSKRVSRRTATASNHAQERILTRWQHQPFCEACRRSSAKRQAEVMDDRVVPSCASGRFR
jgi:hypothetical protein